MSTHLGILKEGCLGGLRLVLMRNFCKNVKNRRFNKKKLDFQNELNKINLGVMIKLITSPKFKYKLFKKFK